jgi:hypothetical protein
VRALTRHRQGGATAVGTIVICALLAALVVLMTPTKAFALSLPEQDYLNRINALRTSVGVQPLEIDSTMTLLAGQHTQVMAAAHDLHHTADLKVGAGTTWTKLGENVGYGNTIELTWNAFVASPKHYENLVDPLYSHIGIVVIQGSDGLLWTTHRFLAAGRPTASTATSTTTGPVATPAPAPVPAPTRAPVVPVVAPTPPPTPAPVPVTAPADPARVATVLNALRAA